MTKLTGQNVEADMTVRNASLVPRRLEHVYCADSIHLHFVAAVRGGFYEILKKLGSLTLFKSDWRNLSELHLPKIQLSGFKCILGDVWGKVTAE